MDKVLEVLSERQSLTTIPRTFKKTLGRQLWTGLEILDKQIKQGRPVQLESFQSIYQIIYCNHRVERNEALVAVALSTTPALHDAMVRYSFEYRIPGTLVPFIFRTLFLKYNKVCQSYDPKLQAFVTPEHSQAWVTTAKELLGQAAPADPGQTSKD